MLISALAFCDWSELQKIRRDMLKVHTFPKTFTDKYNQLKNIISRETENLLTSIPTGTNIKDNVLKTCANIFTRHFCSLSFTYEDDEFQKMVRNFDEVFFEVNQGYLADFLEFLLPFHTKRLSRISSATRDIRQFVCKRIIGKRRENFKQNDSCNDYVDCLIQQSKFNVEDCTLNWNTALFALEDVIGGHSAVGNFLVRVLCYIVRNPASQVKIQDEIDSVTNYEVGRFRKVNISDRNKLPYTEAVILEAVRLISSPIVPRVANQNTSISGKFNGVNQKCERYLSRQVFESPFIKINSTY